MEALKFPTILNIVPTSEAETRAMAKQLVEYVNSGDYNPLQMKCVLNRLSKIIEYVNDNEDYNNAVAAESAKYAESKFSFQRFSIQKSQNVRYEYKGDYVWNDLNAKIKARETFLKTITEPTFDGDGIQVMPAIKKSTDTLTIKPLE
jgi:hypothetical protein